eukprot:9773997-Alexandrium_andersonii.AAC.1
MQHALSHLGGLGKLPGLLHKLNKGPIAFGSLCSGLEIITMVLLALQTSVSMLPGPLEISPVEVVHELSCEIDSRKRELCPLISPNVKHVYADVVKLAKGPCYDFVEKATNSPDPVDILAAGFVCKDLSLMNNKTVKFSGKSGNSIKTFASSVACASKWRPAIIILENVAALLKSRRCDGSAKPIDR